MDAGKAEELIACSFPELEIHNIEALEGGWDNYVFLVNGNIVFRFPLKEEFVLSMKAEIELLSRLDGFPVALPGYSFISSSSSFFAGYQFIEGKPLLRVPVMTDGIMGDMVSIIQYLRNLDVSGIESTGIAFHSPETWKDRMSTMLDRFGNTISVYTGDDVFLEAQSQVDKLLSNIPESSFSLIHSDLYRGNVLVRPDFSGITGVIDWQEAAVGDPAMDVAALALDFGREFTARLAEKTQKSIDPEALQRARLYQKLEPFHILEHRVEHNEMDGVERIVKEIRKNFLEK